jgi:hypothetical protein
LKLFSVLLIKEVAMKSLVFLFVAHYIFIISLFAQAPDTMWTKTFGGVEWDEGRSVQQTIDSGYVIVGGIGGFGVMDVYLIKTDTWGNTLWTKTIGGIDHDVGISVQQTSDGGYIIVGITWSFGEGDSDVWLIKTDASGDTLWTKTFGGVERDRGFSVKQTLDGGYIVTGRTSSFGAGESDMYLIKTDSSGNTDWIKTIGDTSSGRGYSVQQTSDSGYIIAGETSSFGTGGADVWLLKTDTLGDTLWTKTFGGIDADVGSSVQQTTDEGYIITGETSSFGAGDEDVWLIKTDTLGDALWTKTFGGVYGDKGNSVQQTVDGGYIIAGKTSSFGAGDKDVWLIKTNASGDTLWTKTIGGIEREEGFSVKQTLDGGYIIIGYTRSFGAGDEDVWLIKLAPDSIVGVSDEINPTDFSISQNYPNPFNPTTTIKYHIPELSFITLKVYDVLGNEIETLVSEERAAGSFEVKFDATGLPSGIYFYRLQAGSIVETKKMVLMK